MNLNLYASIDKEYYWRAYSWIINNKITAIADFPNRFYFANTEDLLLFRLTFKSS